MNGPDARFGQPFDVVLHLSSQLGDGTSFSDGQDVFPVTARIVTLLARSALGMRAEELSSNVMRILQQVTPEGEPTVLSGASLVDWQFRSEEIARFGAERLLSSVTGRWLSAEEGADGVREEALAAVHGVGAVDDLMLKVQEDEDGTPLLPTFDAELAKSWRRARPKPRMLPAALEAAATSHRERMAEAREGARRRAGELLQHGYVAGVEGDVRSHLDAFQLAAGRALLARAIERLEGLERVLLEQRETLRAELSTTEAEARTAFAALVAAAEPARTAWIKGVGRRLKRYVRAATATFRLRHALDLTEVVLSSLGGGRDRLAELVAAVDGLTQAVAETSRRCRERVDAFESRRLTPVEALLDRPLYETDELRDLFREACGFDWNSVSGELEARVRRALGGFSRLLGLEGAQVETELLPAALTVFEVVAAMNADDFVAWKYRRLREPAAFLLRDSELLAPLLCRIDRARLPEDGDLRESSFTLIGVPDRDSSVFAGTAHGLLVTTGDATRITVLRLRLGFPPSALWQYDRYRQAFLEVRRRGRVAQEIYPNFPHRIREEWDPTDGPGPSRPRPPARKDRRPLTRGPRR